MDKKNKKHQRIAFIVLFSIAIFVVISVIFSFYFSKNYNDIYHYPKNENTVINLTNFDTDKNSISLNLSGDFEFYYNKWIISEDTDAKMDAIVNVPHRFNGMEIDGKKIDSTGYASYKMYVKGLKKGSSITPSLLIFMGGYRSYVNGELCCEYGSMEKNRNAVSMGEATFEKEYVVKSDNETLEIVFEISQSSEGGLYRAAWINTKINRQLYWLARNVGMYCLGIISCLVLFLVIINLGLSKKQRQWSFVLLITLNLLLFVFSIDCYWRICVLLQKESFNIILNANFLLQTMISCLFLYHLIKIKAIKNNIVFNIIYLLILLSSSIGFYITEGTNIRPIFAFIEVFTMLSLLVMLAININNEKLNNYFYMGIITFIVLSNYLSLIDLLGVVRFGLEVITSFDLLIESVIIALMFLSLIRSNSKKAMKAIYIEKEFNEIKSEALRSQIKPHFIFNSLTRIQDLYNIDFNKADYALGKFSNYLRINVDAMNKEICNFKEEIENILNYVEIESIRYEKEINLLLNCEEYDMIYHSIMTKLKELRMK